MHAAISMKWTANRSAQQPMAKKKTFTKWKNSLWTQLNREYAKNIIWNLLSMSIVVLFVSFFMLGSLCFVFIYLLTEWNAAMTTTKLLQLQNDDFIYIKIERCTIGNVTSCTSYNRTKMKRCGTFPLTPTNFILFLIKGN